MWDRVEKLRPDIANIGWDKFDFYSPSFDTEQVKKEDLIKYVMAAYLYVLKDKVLQELTIGFIPRFIKLLYLVFRTGTLRGNLSVTFSACVNLFLEEWFILTRLEERERLHYIKEMFAIGYKIKNAEKN